MPSNPATTTPQAPVWALPTLNAHPRLFMTPARLTRFQNNWASPSATLTGLKSAWNTTSQVMGNLLIYRATGSTSNLTSAYNSAIGQSYNLVQNVTAMYADYSAWVLDWGYANLTSTQKSNLISQIDANNGTRMAHYNSGTAITGGQEECLCGFLVGLLSVQGESGATNRMANIRNWTQNLQQWLDEVSADGHFWAYGERGLWLIMLFMAYGIATNQESFIFANCSYLRNRIKCLARRTRSNGFQILCGPSDMRGDIDNKEAYLIGESAPQLCIAADMLSDGLWQWMTNNNINGTSLKWNNGAHQLVTDCTWPGLIFYNPAITATPPATYGLPVSASLPLPGQVHFQGGWNTATDVRAWLYASMSTANPHDTIYGGHLEINRGDDQLIDTAYTYAGQPSTWQNGPPPTSGQVGFYSMVCSTMLFTLSGASQPERKGCQVTVAPAGSNGAYPRSNQFGVDGGAWLIAKVARFIDGGTAPGAEVNGVADCTNAYLSTQVTNYQRYVSYVNGSASTRGTFVIRDKFTTGGSVARIRQFWYCKLKPVGVTGQSIQSGVSAAGVMTITNTQIVIQYGSSQATIQCVSPTSLVAKRLVGGGNGIGGAPSGAGYESYFDGANLDYLANSQDHHADLYAKIQGHWRIELETTPGASAGTMVTVITIDSTGTTAPTYNLASAQALAPNAFVDVGGVTPPPPPQTGTALGLPFNPSLGRMLYVLKGANMNTTADQQMAAIGAPSPTAVINAIYITNASTSLTTAVGGFYTNASKVNALVANTQVYSSLTSGSKLLSATLTSVATTNVLSSGPFLSLTTAQGATATADIYLLGSDLTH